MSTGPAAPAAPAVDATPNATAEQAGSTFKPPEIQIEPLQLSSIQQNTVSPRRVGETTSRRQYVILCQSYFRVILRILSLNAGFFILELTNNRFLAQNVDSALRE